MTTFYNDNDDFCCSVLRARVADGRLPGGLVDGRSIADIRADDVVGYRQCHFFAGIGGFALAAKLAGWPQEEELWTGGFPCQDISSAGQGEGIVKGERSRLYWELFRLIAERRPLRFVLENVPALRTRGIEYVLGSLEGIGYEVAHPFVVGAWSVRAPHKRDRVCIVGRLPNPDGIGRKTEGNRWPSQHEHARDAGEVGSTVADSARSRQRSESEAQRADRMRTWAGGDAGMADSEHMGRRTGRREQGDEAGEGSGRDQSSGSLQLADSNSKGLAISKKQTTREECAALERSGCSCRWPAGRGYRQHSWEAPRLVEFPVGGLVDGIPVRLVHAANRNALKAYGNAIVPQVFAAVLKALMKATGIEGE